MLYKVKMTHSYHLLFKVKTLTWKMVKCCDSFIHKIIELNTHAILIQKVVNGCLSDSMSVASDVPHIYIYI